ncbi:ABC transporter permease [Halostella sp. PRR32]|uniref:ABC transporter permease n=1 Tax=Halostella sp. PRR32 TaxID=3098147 RepID=UPI002B1D8B41|nr:ABC transporter permease [Halostella sp. PRR32]
MSSENDSPLIESINWESRDGGWSVPWQFVGLVLSLGALLALRLHYGEHGDAVLMFPSRLTWVYRAGLVVLAFIVVPPLVRDPARTRRYWDRFASNRVAVVCLGYLAVVVSLALLAPVLVERAQLNLYIEHQPPAFITAPAGDDCIGPVVTSGGEEFCRGTLNYPLGTAHRGYSMHTLLLWGLRTSLQMAVIATVIMVPLATAVGVVAGYVGGWVDTLLMGYVDVQQSVPAFVIYVILIFIYGRSLLLLAVVFSLLSWGSMARLVRSETLQRREEGYIEAARSAGVGHLTVLRRHVLPNVSNTVLVGATQKVPQLILIEAAITFLSLGDIGRWYPSFGQTIRNGFRTAGGMPPLAALSPMAKWWVWLFPVVLLSSTVIALNVVGDTLRDVLDPRGET